MELYPVLCKIAEDEETFSPPRENMSEISRQVTEKALEILGQEKLNKMLEFLNANSAPHESEEGGQCDELQSEITEFLLRKIRELGIEYDDCLYNGDGVNFEDLSSKQQEALSDKEMAEFKVRSVNITKEQHIFIGRQIIEELYEFCKYYKFDFDQWYNTPPEADYWTCVERRVELNRDKQPRTIKIEVITLTIDDQAGGYDIQIFNNQEEMFAQIEEDRSKALSKEKKKEILEGDDEYENGYLGKSTIKVEISEDGTACLVEPVHFHAGQ